MSSSSVNIANASQEVGYTPPESTQLSPRRAPLEERIPAYRSDVIALDVFRDFPKLQVCFEKDNTGNITALPFFVEVDGSLQIREGIYPTELENEMNESCNGYSWAKQDCKDRIEKHQKIQKCLNVAVVVSGAACAVFVFIGKASLIATTWYISIPLGALAAVLWLIKQQSESVEASSKGALDFTNYLSDTYQSGVQEPYIKFQNNLANALNMVDTVKTIFAEDSNLESIPDLRECINKLKRACLQQIHDKAVIQLPDLINTLFVKDEKYQMRHFSAIENYQGIFKVYLDPLSLGDIQNRVEDLNALEQSNEFRQKMVKSLFRVSQLAIAILTSMVTSGLAVTAAYVAIPVIILLAALKLLLDHLEHLKKSISSEKEAEQKRTEKLYQEFVLKEQQKIGGILRKIECLEKLESNLDQCVTALNMLSLELSACFDQIENEMLQKPDFAEINKRTMPPEYLSEEAESEDVEPEQVDIKIEEAELEEESA